MTIGERLRELRLYEAMSQPELGRFVGISASTMSCIERDKYYPQFDVLRSYARVFKMSLSELLKGVE